MHAGPRGDDAPGEALVLVAVSSAMTRTLLFSGLRRSGFAAETVASAEEARAVLEAHGTSAVLLVDGPCLVEEGRAWRGLAEARPDLPLVALRVASRTTFAADWVAELGCECLEDPLDLQRVVEVLRRVRSASGGSFGRSVREDALTAGKGREKRSG